jgi:hypothetical protein
VVYGASHRAGQLGTTGSIIRNLLVCFCTCLTFSDAYVLLATDGGGVEKKTGGIEKKGQKTAVATRKELRKTMRVEKKQKVNRKNRTQCRTQVAVSSQAHLT